MSTLQVEGIRNAAASSDAISFATDGTCTAKVTNNLSNRNVIQNGAAAIAQRYTSDTGVTTSGDAWIVDRFEFDPGGSSGTYTISQDSSGPPGFANSMKVLVTSVVSPSAASLAQIMLALEGQDLQRFCKGTASAKKFALSFWVKAKITGTYVCELYDSDNTRQTSKQYSISSADTWEKKTVIFEADTTGAFDDDNAKSLIVLWKLLAGSNWNSGTLQTSWAANTNANRAVGQVNGMATNNDYFQMTGVQLEVGSVATDFEHRSFGQDLALCQRYCYVFNPFHGSESMMYVAAYGNSWGQKDFHFPVTMRAAPSSEVSDISGVQEYRGGSWNNRTYAVAGDSKFFVTLRSQGSDNEPQLVRASSGTPVCTCSAEL